jgi:hypothetical protein
MLSGLDSKYISSDDIGGFKDTLIEGILEILKGVLAPVYVSKSNELLLNKIYGLSIALFIFSLLIIILFIGFILNILVFVYSDRILKYFTN